MYDWMAKFFEYGHTIEYVYDMNYWEYLKIIESFARISEKQKPGGKYSPGKKTQMHQEMINKAKEGRKNGK